MEAAGGSIRYEYDAAGNMLTKTQNSVKTAMTYNAANQLIQSVKGGETTTYSYDTNGNLVKSENAAGARSYAYNARNLLAKFTREDGYSESYTYNANRLLSSVTTSEDLTTTLTWDILYGDGVVLQSAQNGEKTSFVYGLERVSAISAKNRTEYVYDGGCGGGTKKVEDGKNAVRSLPSVKSSANACSDVASNVWYCSIVDDENVSINANNRITADSPKIGNTDINVCSTTPNINRRPYTGEPGSTYTAPNGDTRTYGSDGTPAHDYDHDDHGFPDKHPHDENGGHHHDWKDGERGGAYVPEEKEDNDSDKNTSKTRQRSVSVHNASVVTPNRSVEEAISIGVGIISLGFILGGSNASHLCFADDILRECLVY